MKFWSWSANSIEHGQTAHCTDMQAGLAPYWWQRLITFSFGLIREHLSPAQVRDKGFELPVVPFYVYKPYLYMRFYLTLHFTLK